MLLWELKTHDRFKAAELASLMDEVGHERVGICLDPKNGEVTELNKFPKKVIFEATLT
jgi:hypothetical protein